MKSGREDHTRRVRLFEDMRADDADSPETPAAKPGSRTVGEGYSRTARMYVPEESHDGIVPMNHSNDESFEQRQKTVGGE